MIDSERLSAVLDIAPGDLGRGLRRLIDEHLISAKEDGRIGGLHQLRSTMLFHLCHAYPPPAPLRTVTEAVHCVRSDSLEALAAHVLVDHPDATSAFVAALAARLESEHDPVALVTALFGMGQAHIEATLRPWVAKVQSDGLESSQVSLAAMFAVANTDVSSIPLPDRLRSAVGALRRRSVSDPRSDLLSALSRASLHQMVAAADTYRLRALIGALVGMELPETLRSALLAVKPDFDAVDDRPAHRIELDGGAGAQSLTGPRPTRNSLGRAGYRRSGARRASSTQHHLLRCTLCSVSTQ